MKSKLKVMLPVTIVIFLLANAEVMAEQDSNVTLSGSFKVKGK